MPKDPAIKVQNLSKSFKLPHNRQSSLKGALINLVSRGDRTYETQEVLRDISFEIKQGEFFGIVGRNGSGKSTLLKLLAGIYTPTKGAITVNGSLTPFIELGVGFNPELTGRENVYLNGALLGFNNKEMDAMYDDIVSFAELERFMDQKLKNYSSGMQVRLAFSIAIRAQSDILLLDEVLAVGDAAFQRKCFDYFMELKKQKQTVVLVTHDMSAVRQYCDRAMMIERGEVVALGNVEKVTQRYLNLFNDSSVTSEASSDTDQDNRWGTGRIKAQLVRINTSPDEITIKATYHVNEASENPVFGFNIYGAMGMNILEGNTIREKVDAGAVHPGQDIDIVWKFPNILTSGTYTVSVSSCNRAVSEFYDWWNNAGEIKIMKYGNTAAVTDPGLSVSLKKNKG